ncbi:MAG: hypothetical protein V4820_11060 [Pseudomonadota bacterium]|uniref:hypothetical protein n=1 Tax=Phenylobacterium sp. TaxID=1871053 RepID=UPI0027215A59|nr:hypothetical protein [Phenylobacterium sp.]MDO9431286.1 hypothetical protein [Phenylobacterium sp.]
MAESVDRFLRHRPRISTHAPLGRVFSVTQQSWALTDDPKKTPPTIEVIATGRSAAEAADVARASAATFNRHGFHKPSGAWWASEGGRFHRFVIGNRGRASATLVAGIGLAGVVAGAAGLAFAQQRTKDRRRS